MTQNRLADPECPVCHGEGFIYLDTESIIPMRARRCACLEKRAAELEGISRLESAHIPPKFASATFDGFHIREGVVKVDDADRRIKVEKPISAWDIANRDTAIELASHPLAAGTTIFFSGPYGTGKTYLACALLRAQIVEQGRSGLYLSVSRFISGLLPDAATKEEQRIARTAPREIDLLLLDDLGVEKTSAFSMRELFNLLDERWLNERPTIITSNLSLTAALGERPDTGRLNADEAETHATARRILSRLTEDAVKIDWPPEAPDFRKEAFAESNAAHRQRMKDRRESEFTQHKTERLSRANDFYGDNGEGEGEKK